jgi:hypothetical protein
MIRIILTLPHKELWLMEVQKDLMDRRKLSFHLRLDAMNVLWAYNQLRKPILNVLSKIPQDCQSIAFNMCIPSVGRKNLERNLSIQTHLLTCNGSMRNHLNELYYLEYLVSLTNLHWESWKILFQLLLLQMQLFPLLA